MKNTIKILGVFFLFLFFSCDKNNDIANELECNDNRHCGLLFVLDKTSDFYKDNFLNTSRGYFYKEENGKEVPLGIETNTFTDTSNKFMGLSISKKSYHKIINGKLETFYLKTPKVVLKIEIQANLSEYETAKKNVLEIDRIYINGVTPRDIKTDFSFSREYLLENYKFTE